MLKVLADEFKHELLTPNDVNAFRSADIHTSKSCTRIKMRFRPTILA